MIHTTIKPRVFEENPNDSIFDLIDKYDVNGIRQRLTKNPSEIKARLPSGQSVLHHAVQMCLSIHMEILTLLIAVADIDEVDIFCEDNQGRSPLHTACFFGKFPHAQYLLTVYGEDIAFEIDKNGCTPLQLQLYHKTSLELFINELKSNPKLHVEARNEIKAISETFKSRLVEHTASEVEQRELLRTRLREEIEAEERGYVEAFKKREGGSIPAHLVRRWSNGFHADNKISERSFYKGIVSVSSDVQAVAIKVVTDVASYLNEVKVLTALQHPHLIPVLGHSQAEAVDSPCYIVFPYAANRGLDSMLRNDGTAKLMICSKRITIASQVAEVLQYLHGSNLCHGSFNTSNVVLTTDLTPKVINFGLATQLTAEGCTSDVQTFGYFLRELIFPGDAAADTPDSRAGVWASGCISEFNDLIARCASDASLTFSAITGIMDGLTSRYGVAPSSSEEMLLSLLAESNARTAASSLQEEIKASKKCCSICWLEYPLRDGIMCHAVDPSKAHYRCNDCFSNTVQHQAAIDYRHTFISNNCKVICGICNDANSNYSDAQVASHASEAAFLLYKTALIEAEVEKVSVIYNRRIAKLQKAIMLTTTSEKLLENHYLHVAENILTLHCPSCKTAVLDFDGCFAVKCNCNSYFCGWCLAGYKGSDECHSHVKACPQSGNKGDYYGSAELFVAHHRERRSRELRDYIVTKIPLEDQEKFKQMLHKQVTELELTIED